MSRGEQITIVLPYVSDDAVSEGLRKLTKAIDKSGTAAASQGLLGGQWGYGAEYENETFMMHPYCWCEKPDCEWCAGCECPDDSFHYFIGEREVGYDEYRAEYEVSGNAIRNESQDQDKLCRYCRGEFGHAPNFHHKASGFKVWWYKYCGRDMETENPGGMIFGPILAECLASLKTTSKKMRSKR